MLFHGNMALVIDFDGTITTRDTLADLAAHAAMIHRDRDQECNPELIWESIVKSYIQDRSEYARTYEPTEEHRKTFSQEIAFLRGLETVDTRSRERLEDSKLFARVPGWVLQGAPRVRPVPLRNGFREFINHAHHSGLKVVVLSCNWSTGFVTSVLNDPDIEVIANEITDEGKIVGPPGMLDGDQALATCHDKKKVLDIIISRQNKHVTQECPRLPPLLYIGDSATDLECLTTSRGIVIAEDEEGSTLLNTLARIGFQVPIVPHHDVVEISWARDFRQLLDAGIIEILKSQLMDG